MEESPTPAKREFLSLGLVLFLSVAGVAAFEGRYVWHDYREAQRVKTDPHVRGRVVELRDTGDRIHDDPAVEVTVEFTTLDGVATRAQTIERMGVTDAVTLSKNYELDVWYNPKDPTDVVIRWRSRP